MKLLFTAILLLVLSFSVQSQDWLTNLDEAKQLASENNENILLVFQGSDWCAPCMKLDKEIWSSDEFEAMNDSHFIMLKSDFPRKKANQLSQQLQIQNAALAERYNAEGFFPLVVILDKSGNILGKMGYEKLSPNAYFEKLIQLEQ